MNVSGRFAAGPLVSVNPYLVTVQTGYSITFQEHYTIYIERSEKREVSFGWFTNNVCTCFQHKG